jgi:hypothetical protein
MGRAATRLLIIHNSVQNILSSHLLSKNTMINIYRNILLPVILYGCETRFLTLREERRLWVFENRVLRRIFGSKRTTTLADANRTSMTNAYCMYTVLRYS